MTTGRASPSEKTAVRRCSTAKLDAETEDIVKAMGLQLRDLFPEEAEERKLGGYIWAVWTGTANSCFKFSDTSQRISVHGDPMATADGSPP